MNKNHPEIILENREMPELEFRAAIVPGSIDEENRTIRVEYTTGARVYRRKYFEDDYYEELSLQKGHVRLSRMNGGAAPVLNSHSNWDLSDVMGTVIEADERFATLKFSKRDEVAGFWNDIKDGIIRSVSVGYMVHRYQDVTPEGDKVKVLRAIDWEPFEISMVAIPADAGAGVRSKQTNRCVVIGAQAETNEKGHSMTKPENTQESRANDQLETRGTDTQAPANPAPAQPAPVADTRTQEEIAQNAIAAERQRSADIRALGTQHNVAETVIEELVRSGATIEAARAKVLDHLAEQGDTAQTRSNIRITRDERETRTAAMENAIMHRVNPSLELSEAGREFRGLSLLEMAREAIGYRETRGLSKNQIVERAFHSTSDFPLLLANIANKSLRTGYGDTKRTFQPFTRQVTLPDFKNVSRLALSNASSLERIVEGGEYKHGTFSENGETYRLFTYGKKLSITREAIINDDLDAFTRIPQKMAAAAARLENRMVYDILLGNPVMSDGTALFHANHGNLVNNLLNVAGIAALRKAMRVQKDPSGEDNLNLEMKYLIVPAALELAAAQLKAQITAAKTSDVNPYTNSFEIITEGYLDGTDAVSYYGAASPNEVDTIEYAYLEGESGPYIETREGFDRDGLEIKIRHDFATKAIDFRGLAKSTNNGS